MTDDLLKRLRDNAAISTALSRIYDDEILRYEAADRIEELEAALREIADGPRHVDKSYISLLHEIQSEARKALEGKDD